MHTVMGRDGHALLGEKGEVLRSALLIPDGSPWETKDKVYTCEVGVVPGYHPNLAACLEEHFGDQQFGEFAALFEDARFIVPWFPTVGSHNTSPVKCYK